MVDILMPLKFTCMLADSWGTGFLSNHIQDKPEVGSGIARARTTKVLEFYSWTASLSAENNQEFRKFYKTTLVGGVRPFIYTHVFTGEEILCRFIESPSEKFTHNKFHRGIKIQEI